MTPASIETGQGSPAPPPVVKPIGKPYDESREFGVWMVIGVFAAGAAIGAAAAALFTPESGVATRRNMTRRVRRLTGREKSTWKKLRRTLDRAMEDRRVRKRAEELRAERLAAEAL